MTAEEKLQEAIDQAKEVGLRYVYDSDTGFTRRRVGKSFSYIDDKGKKLAAEHVARCKKLAVPPAWENVWFCRYANGHIQATGTDARGRKQYKYHDDWRRMRDENKFVGMATFGEKLPALRRRIQAALSPADLSRECVIAAICRMLDRTGLRVGNDAYTDENNTFGITTLRKKHLDVHGTEITLDFVGKGNKGWSGTINDARLAEVINACSDLPGYRLFKYRDNKGDMHDVTSTDVNAWLHDVTGEDITAKDFRTWAACTLFLESALKNCAEKTFHLKPVLENVAAQLGNTPAILKKSYVHPDLMDLYRTGCFLNKEWQEVKSPVPGLRKSEALLLAWLKGPAQEKPLPLKKALKASIKKAA